jgi:hypothetical protein
VYNLFYGGINYEKIKFCLICCVNGIWYDSC